MNSDSVNYRISDEPIDYFVKRNNHPARCQYPQNLRNGLDVKLSPSIPFLPIDDWLLTEDWNEMLAEAVAIEKDYVLHRSRENHQGWSSLCLHGISSSHTEGPEIYGYTNENCPWQWTDMSDRCPTITSFFKEKFDYTSYHRIRIMKLAPGGQTRPHRDYIAEEKNNIGSINIALNNPDGCYFYMDNVGYLPWTQGRAIALNLSHVHSVVNNSNENRYHLIIHGNLGKSWSHRFYSNYRNWKKTYS